MKYIRTKDGIYEILEKHKLPIGGEIYYITNCINKNFYSYEVIKQADSIEELFDEFRGIWINYYESEKKDAHEEYHYDKGKNVFYADFDELTPKEAIEKFDIFYGAIWTDEGLIYRARMKGVLPNGKIDWELL